MLKDFILLFILIFIPGFLIFLLFYTQIDMGHRFYKEISDIRERHPSMSMYINEALEDDKLSLKEYDKLKVKAKELERDHLKFDLPEKWKNND